MPSPTVRFFPITSLVESDWSTLKTELFQEQAVFDDVPQAIAEIEYYLGTYFNSCNSNSAIFCCTPTQFEQQATFPNQP